LSTLPLALFLSGAPTRLGVSLTVSANNIEVVDGVAAIFKLPIGAARQPLHRSTT